MTPLCDPRSPFLMRELHSDDEGQPVAIGERTGAVSERLNGCYSKPPKLKPYGNEIDPRCLKRVPERTLE